MEGLAMPGGALEELTEIAHGIHPAIRPGGASLQAEFPLTATNDGVTSR